MQVYHKAVIYEVFVCISNFAQVLNFLDYH